MSITNGADRDRVQREYNRLTHVLNQYPNRTDVRPLVIQRHRQRLAEELARYDALDADPLATVSTAVLWVRQRAELHRWERERRRNEWRARLMIGGCITVCLAILVLLWWAGQ